MNSSSPKQLFISVVVGTGVVVGLWLAFWNSPLGIVRADERGQFGDKFGALNCLFAGLGFVAIVSTLIYQHAEDRKKDLETKALLDKFRRAADALEAQAATTQQTRYLTALVARIEGYTVQFKQVFTENTPLCTQLMKEQDLLLWELDDLLNRFREEAGGRRVTPQEVERRLQGK